MADYLKVRGEPEILAFAPGTAMLASLVDGVFIIDSRGCIHYANASAARMFGYELNDMIGASIETLMPEAVGSRHQSYIDRYLAGGQERVIGRGRAVEGVTRDGRRLQIYLAVSEFSYRGGRHFIGITHDRTAEATATTQLQRSLDRLRRSQRLGNVGSWEWTIDDDSIFWSETIGPMFGLPAGERQIHFQDFIGSVHPEDRAGLLAAISACTESGNPYRVEHRVVWPDGTVRWLIAEGDIEDAADGGVRRMLGVIRDISSRKMADAALMEAKEAAEQASRAQAVFISSMSHEIRTPLNTILGYASLLDLSSVDSDNIEKNTRYLRSIVDSGQHLLDIVNNILDLALIESGRLALTIVPSDISLVVSEAIGIVNLMAERKSIAISANVPSSKIHALADASRLRQVMVNLLSNAIKYNFDNGKVDVRISVLEERLVRIEVADTGCGISEEKQKGVFERFNRLGAERSSIEGAGIGLTLSRHLIVAMGGDIGFVSNPGKGTLFWVDLQLNSYGHYSEARQEDHVIYTPAGRAEAPRSVLVVEDNALNFEVLREVLLALGDFTIKWARDIVEVSEIISESRPGLIFLDINLPDHDGFAVARMLQNTLREQTPPVFGLSANIDETVKLKATDHGFTGYIVKPFRIGEIRDALNAAFG